MERPAVLVVAVPYVLATALGAKLATRNRYEVVVPNFGAGEVAPPSRWDAVLSVHPVPADTGSIVIELPESWDEPVRVTVRGRTVLVSVSEATPIDDVLALLDDHLFGGDGRVESSRSKLG